ncbi:MAG TPA: lipoyl(octanoyl) transferase LipB [Coxiellaceae bacterium]|nr:lipoyl(octanoyl) transferase LipB [Coxiellaceae bacterium]
MSSIIIQDLGLCDYQKTWQNMRDFTDSRTEKTPDEIWLLQHPSVFTQGLAGKAEHILNAHNIPVIQTDRGGQVTYHGPGQLVLYALIDLQRKKMHTREFVRTLEKCIIDLLSEMSIIATSKCDAPGVYANDEKICSIGLRVRKGCSYHGIALNVDMDLTPFSYINPCGFQNMKMTQIKTLNPTISLDEIKRAIVPAFLRNFGYNLAI